MLYKHIGYVTLIILSVTKLYASDLSIQGNGYNFKCLSKLTLPINLKFSCLKLRNECFLCNDSFLDISDATLKYERHSIFNTIATCQIINSTSDKSSFYTLGQNGFSKN